jgi:hypothetical protein
MAKSGKGGGRAPADETPQKKEKRQITEKQHRALKNANSERARQARIMREQKAVDKQNKKNSTIIRKRSAARAKQRTG